MTPAASVVEVSPRPLRRFMRKAKIVEVFGSIQGEGPYVGERQVFVRFFGCNMSCRFCDERKKTDFLEYGEADLIEKIIGKGEDTVSLTGGEPLLQADFLKGMLPILKERGLRVYLETNGVLKHALLKVMDHVDIISMDIKLPSSTGRGAYWDAHSEFLKEAARKEVFIKSVVTPKTLLSDIEEAASLVKRVDKNIPFIIQPVSYNGSIESIDLLDTFFEGAKKMLKDVRVIPQVHKILGVK